MINNIDINEILVSNKFPFCKQDFKCCIGNKEDKEIRPLSIFFLKMSVYKKHSVKTKRIYLMIKDWYFFDKYMTIWEKVSNTKKKFKSELIYNKKYLKAEKKIQHKTKLSMLLYNSNIIWFSL